MTEGLVEIVITVAKQLPFATLLGLYVWFARKQEDTREDKRTKNAALAATDWRRFFVKLETSSEKSQEIQATTHANALEHLGEHLGSSLESLGDKIDTLVAAELRSGRDRKRGA